MTMRRNERAMLLGLALIGSLLNVDCFQLTPSGNSIFQKAAFTRTSLHLLPFDKSSSSPDGERERRTMEFLNLGPYAESEARKARMERDNEAKEQFAKYGDELWTLRKKIQKLGENLKAVMHGGSAEEGERLRYELRRAEQRDPELIYELELLEMELAYREGDSEKVKEAGFRAMSARNRLPQYNLEGLWVGK